jgi:hypothetical protein
MHTMLRRLVTVAVVLTSIAGMDAQRKENPVEQPVFYRTVKVDGLSIFYREAGPKDAPTILLLHGFPLRRGCFSRY